MNHHMPDCLNISIQNYPTLKSESKQTFLVHVDPELSAVQKASDKEGGIGDNSAQVPE